MYKESTRTNQPRKKWQTPAIYDMTTGEGIRSGPETCTNKKEFRKYCDFGIVKKSVNFTKVQVPSPGGGYFSVNVGCNGGDTTVASSAVGKTAEDACS